MIFGAHVLYNRFFFLVYPHFGILLGLLPNSGNFLIRILLLIQVRSIFIKINIKFSILFLRVII